MIILKKGIISSCLSNFLLFISVVFSFNAQIVTAETLDKVKAGVLSDIKQSQRRLTALENDISKEKTVLAQAIRAEQQQLLALRAKATINRRLVDDNTLALTQIKDRIKLWRDQANYQKHLLVELAEKINLPIEKVNSVSADNLVGLKVFKEYARANQSALTPNWNTKKIVLANGELVQANSIRLGPINWYLLDDFSQGGLLDDNDRALLAFDDVQTSALVDLFQVGEANVSFDPTLERALQLKKQSESIYEHIVRGGIWALPIIFFALFALLIALSKVWQLWHLPELMPMLAERIDVIARANTIDIKKERLKQLHDQLKGAEQKLVSITLSMPTQEQRDDILLAYLVENRHKLNTRLGAIAITAAVCPLLGLLGTVSGMIETFQMMTIFGAGDPSVVSGGISKALITTELGLVVAIPALILHALLSRKIKAYNTQLDATAIRLGKMELA